MHGQNRPIDLFLRSLAEDQGYQAIGVILSGTASDGALGCQHFKAAGGIIFAQDHTAQQDSMPKSAIAAGCVDYVLPPDKIANELARIARHPYVAPSSEAASPEEKDEPEPHLAKVLRLLREAPALICVSAGKCGPPRRDPLFRARQSGQAGIAPVNSSEGEDYLNRPIPPPKPTAPQGWARGARESCASARSIDEPVRGARHVRVHPPVSFRLPSAFLPALLKWRLTISTTLAEFIQAYRKDTIFL